MINILCLWDVLKMFSIIEARPELVSVVNVFLCLQNVVNANKLEDLADNVNLRMDFKKKTEQ